MNVGDVKYFFMEQCLGDVVAQEVSLGNSSIFGVRVTKVDEKISTDAYGKKQVEIEYFRLGDQKEIGWRMNDYEIGGYISAIISNGGGCGNFKTRGKDGKVTTHKFYADSDTAKSGAMRLAEGFWKEVLKVCK